MDIKTEQIIKMIDDTVLHKKLVLEKCQLLAKHLILNGDVETGIMLLRRGAVHDNSKFSGKEFRQLASIITERTKKCFTDASTVMTDKEKEAIELHWSNNRHHPEYYSNLKDMTKIDILEMVCDWAARSEQYGTNLIEFVAERQRNRFNFSSEMYQEVLEYCYLIEKLSSTVQEQHW